MAIIGGAADTGQLPHPHYIVGRHEDGVFAVADSLWNGRPVIISGGSGWTVRVWISTWRATPLCRSSSSTGRNRLFTLLAD